MKTIKIEANLGDSFENTYKRAKAVTNVEQSAEFVFNGVTIYVHWRSTYDECYMWYNEGLDRNYKAYQESPEGKRQAAEQERRAVAGTLTCCDLIERLPSVTEQDDLISWLKSFTKVGDYAIRVMSQDAIKHIGALGYTRSDCCDDPAVKTDYNVFAKWLVGQCLDGLYTVGVPHPVVDRFCDDYFVLKAGKKL